MKRKISVAKHKRVKGLQVCSCGKYMGIERTWLTIGEFKKKYV